MSLERFEKHCALDMRQASIQTLPQCGKVIAAIILFSILSWSTNVFILTTISCFISCEFAFLWSRSSWVCLWPASTYLVTSVVFKASVFIRSPADFPFCYPVFKSCFGFVFLQRAGWFCGFVWNVGLHLNFLASLTGYLSTMMLQDPNTNWLEGRIFESGKLSDFRWGEKALDKINKLRSLFTDS